METMPTLYLPNEEVENIISQMWKCNNIDDDICDCCYPAISHSIASHSSSLGVEMDVVSLLKDKGFSVTNEGFTKLPSGDVKAYIAQMSI